MKTSLLTLILVLAFGFARAQKAKGTEVPAAVKNKFAALYPDVKTEKWEKEGANYEAEFDLNHVETSVVIDANGNLVETETEISPGALPQAVKDYVAKNLAGKKIKEASKIVDANGKISWEAEVDEVDYIFDEAGNFLKKESEDGDNDKDGDKDKD